MRTSETALLCTTGLSPAVVMEAYLLCGSAPDAVHCLTTDSERTPSDLLHAFFMELGVPFTCTRVARLENLRSGDDQALFDEVLYRWYLNHRQASENLMVCLAGGFKTMSTTMQLAAAYFGAEAVFHVLAADNPSTVDEIRAALATGGLHRIDLPAAKGWIPLRRLRAADYGLAEVEQRNGDPCMEPRNDGRPLLTAVIEEETQRAFEIRPCTGLPPFPAPTLLAGHERAWLEAPFDPLTDADWIRRLPKVELHCHLGGFAHAGDLLHRVRSAAEAPEKLPALLALSPPPGWPRPDKTIGLNAYMELGDNTGSKLMHDAGCLQEQCRLLYKHLMEQHVMYAEIRCSPNNYSTAERSAWDVLQLIRETFQRCMNEARRSAERPCHVNLIIIATRNGGGDLSSISRHLSLAVTAAQHYRNPEECRIVAVDLAGFESPETRPSYFRELFSGIHRCGLAVTVHAGENDDAESIWQAVYALHARRLGHALHLLAAPDLLTTVIDRQIGVEMCPYANYQIKGFGPMGGRPSYPLLDYLRRGVVVSANTDNIGISSASLSENLLFLGTLCPGIRRKEMLQLERNALDSAFIDTRLRSRLVETFENALFEELFV